jgi:hypothetical protein
MGSGLFLPALRDLCLNPRRLLIGLRIVQFTPSSVNAVSTPRGTPLVRRRLTSNPLITETSGALLNDPRGDILRENSKKSNPLRRAGHWGLNSRDSSAHEPHGKFITIKPFRQYPLAKKFFLCYDFRW